MAVAGKICTGSEKATVDPRLAPTPAEIVNELLELLSEDAAGLGIDLWANHTRSSEELYTAGHQKVKQGIDRKLAGGDWFSQGESTVAPVLAGSVALSDNHLNRFLKDCITFLLEALRDIFRISLENLRIEMRERKWNVLTKSRLV